jgi:Ras-related protein Rab-39B
MTIDNETVDAEFMDISSTTIRNADATFSSDVFMDIFTRASGVVLLYDVASLNSFEHITNQAYMYVWMCKRYRGEVGSCEFVLVGNKADVLQTKPNMREVDKELAEQWAQSQGMKHFELTTHNREQVQEAVYALMRAIKRARKRAEKERNEESRRPKQTKTTSIRNKLATAIRKPPPST